MLLTGLRLPSALDAKSLAEMGGLEGLCLSNVILWQKASLRCVSDSF